MTEPRSDWYDIGDHPVLRATFRNGQSKQLVDPTLVTCTVRDPAGGTSTPAVTRVSTGVYTATVSPGLHGVWQVRWLGTGDGAAAEPDHFLVRESNI